MTEAIAGTVPAAAAEGHASEVVADRSLLETAWRGLVRVAETGAVISAAIVLVLTVLISVDVLGRFFFSAPLQGAYEFTQTLMVAIVFLGMACVQAARGNIGFDFVLDRLSPGPKWAVSLFNQLMALAIMSVATWQTFQYASFAYQIGDFSPGRIPFPLWPEKALVPLGFFFVTLVLLTQILLQIAGRLRRSEATGLPAASSQDASFS